ncbi:glycosyltransferase [Vibrio cyclitrophicus]
MNGSTGIQVGIVSHSDSGGGAARASLRLALALRKNDVETRMFVSRKGTDYQFIQTKIDKFSRAISFIRPTFGSIITRLLKTKNPCLHSGNWFHNSLLTDINNENLDIINLHWINGETLSISDISKISKPIVMTLHDMWAFCGAEHLCYELEDIRYKSGYLKGNFPKTSSGLDINRLVWNRKKKCWSKKFYIVCPSQWLAECAKSSALFNGWPIYVIPNPLDLMVFKKIDKYQARDIINLPKSKKLIGFGAIGGLNQKHKGFDLLIESLKKISDINSSEHDIEVVIFGESEPYVKPDIDFPIHYLGELKDDTTLAITYNSLDVMVVPSRVENLPQTATESIACGVPVVAFNTSGIPSAVSHNLTGYLAKAFDIDDMIEGINYCLKHGDILSNHCVQYAKEYWSEEVVAQKYKQLYRETLDATKK